MAEFRWTSLFRSSAHIKLPATLYSFHIISHAALVILRVCFPPMEMKDPGTIVSNKKGPEESWGLGPLAPGRDIGFVGGLVPSCNSRFWT